MNLLRMTISGLAGALALTGAHQVLKRYNPDAPHMDSLGMQGIDKVMRTIGLEPMSERPLFQSALAADLLSNSIYYSQVGAAKGGGAWLRGIVLGLTAGIGAVKLPPKLGLSSAPSSRTHQTELLTVGLYLLGGLAAAAAAQLCCSDDKS